MPMPNITHNLHVSSPLGPRYREGISSISYCLQVGITICCASIFNIRGIRGALVEESLSHRRHRFLISRSMSMLSRRRRKDTGMSRSESIMSSNRVDELSLCMRSEYIASEEPELVRTLTRVIKHDRHPSSAYLPRSLQQVSPTPLGKKSPPHGSLQLASEDSSSCPESPASMSRDPEHTKPHHARRLAPLRNRQ